MDKVDELALYVAIAYSIDSRKTESNPRSYDEKLGKYRPPECEVQLLYVK